MPTFQQQGGLVSLSSFPGGASYIEARTGPGASVYKSPDGQYYQMPWKSNPVMIFYNKKVFAKAGISTTNPPLSTYSEFLATAKKLVSSGAAQYAIYPAPTSEFFQSWYDFYPMYAAETGGTELVENGKATFNSTAGDAVAAFWQQMYAQNLAGKESYTNDPFADRHCRDGHRRAVGHRQLSGQGRLGRSARADHGGQPRGPGPDLQ